MSGDGGYASAPGWPDHVIAQAREELRRDDLVLRECGSRDCRRDEKEEAQVTHGADVSRWQASRQTHSGTTATSRMDRMRMDGA